MSHLSTFKNETLKNVEKEMLEKSLAELGLSLDYNDKHFENTWIQDTVNYGTFRYHGKKIAAGINMVKDEKGDTRVEISGDFYGTGIDDSEIMNAIAQVYQKNDIVKRVTNARWSVDSVEKNQENEYEIMVSRFA